MEKVLGAIMQTAEGVYEVYEIDRQKGTVSGYKCFPGAGESNPCRTFPIESVRFYNMRKH